MTAPARRSIPFSLVAVALQLAGCAAPPAGTPELRREVAALDVRRMVRDGALDAVSHLRVVGSVTDRRDLDAETIARLLRLPALCELDLGALPGLWRSGEQVTVAAGTQLLLAQLRRADLRPVGRPRLVIRSEDGTTLPVLADLARPFSVELDLSGQLVPSNEPPQRFGSSFDPAVQRRLAAQTLVQAAEHLARCCELVR